MQIEHVAIWTPHLEQLKQFYEQYFGARSGPRYENPRKCFQSFFLSFSSGARLEIMSRPDLLVPPPPTTTTTTNQQQPTAAPHPLMGYAHLAFSTGSMAAVDALTQKLREDGHVIVDGPRRTGDGYYESVVLDPDGNTVEITL